MTQDQTPDLVLETFIRCTQDALWEALTDAVVMGTFNCHADRAERDGDLITYLMPDGAPMLRMRDLDVTPKTRLEQTFEPLWEPGIEPGRVVQIVTPFDGYCALRVEHYNAGELADGYREGWSRDLAAMKTFLETGEVGLFDLDMEAEA